MTEKIEGAPGAKEYSLPARREPSFVRKVLIVYGIGAVFIFLLALLWYAATVVLLAFSGILVAVLLHDASGILEKHLPLSRAPALALVLLLAFGLLGLTGWFMAPQVVVQINQLVADLPAALQRLRDYLASNPPLQEIVHMLPPPEEVFKDASSLMMRAGSVFSGLLGVLGNIFIIFFVAIYLAYQPSAYMKGILKLVPPERRGRGRTVLRELGETLSLWLRGKLLSMAVIGVTTAIGLSILGVPLALALGIVAGLLDFIPYIGPILAAIPAVLIAFSQEPMLAFYVILLFVALQVLEGYLLLPLVERKTVSMPPALTITMQILMGLAFGLAGVALATPLTAVLAVLIAMLYVEDVLDDQVKLPTDKE